MYSFYKYSQTGVLTLECVHSKERRYMTSPLNIQGLGQPSFCARETTTACFGMQSPVRQGLVLRWRRNVLRFWDVVLITNRVLCSLLGTESYSQENEIPKSWGRYAASRSLIFEHPVLWKLPSNSTLARSVFDFNPQTILIGFGI